MKVSGRLGALQHEAMAAVTQVHQERNPNRHKKYEDIRYFKGVDKVLRYCERIFAWPVCGYYWPLGLHRELHNMVKGRLYM